MQIIRTVLLMLTIIAMGLVQNLYAQDDLSQDIVLVANADVPGDSLDSGMVENIFIGKMSLLNGKKIEVTILNSGTAHDILLKYYIKKTESQFLSNWKKLVFSGKAKMPNAFASEKDMVEYVAKTSGAIGYIHVNTSKDTSVMTDKVKVITIKK